MRDGALTLKDIQRKTENQTITVSSSISRFRFPGPPQIRISSRSCDLEGVVGKGSHQVSKTALVGGTSLHEKPCGGPHGKAAIGDLLCLQPLEFLWVALAEAKGVEAKVAGGTHAGLAAGGGGNTTDELSDGDHD